MKVTSASIDGVPAEVFFQESVRGRALRGSENDVFLMVAPEALAADSEHEFEFEHEGAVIVSAGNGVFFVNARSDLVSPRCGGVCHLRPDVSLSQGADAGGGGRCGRGSDRRRLARHATGARRIRFAWPGFNLGDYEKVSGNVPGYTIDVYGNRHLQASLAAKPPRRRSIRRRACGGHAGRPAGRSGEPGEPLCARSAGAAARARAQDVSSSLEFFARASGLRR